MVGRTLKDFVKTLSIRLLAQEKRLSLKHVCFPLPAKVCVLGLVFSFFSFFFPLQKKKKGESFSFSAPPQGEPSRSTLPLLPQLIRLLVKSPFSLFFSLA